VVWLMVATQEDLALTVWEAFGSHESERTVYVRHGRRREEFRPAVHRRRVDGSDSRSPGPRLATITRCDLGMRFHLNLDDCEYARAEIPGLPASSGDLSASWVEVPAGPPTVVVETTTVDTGDRKVVFGLTARRVLIRRTETPVGPGADDRQETRSEGWYVDLDPTLPCDHRWAKPGVPVRTFASLRPHGAPAPVPEFRDVGEPETGLAIELDSVTVRDRRDLRHPGEYQLRRTKVRALSTAPIDAALFDVPVGFRQVAAIRHTGPTPPWARVVRRLRGLLHV
jgi:hypothetical protein